MIAASDRIASAAEAKAEAFRASLSAFFVSSLLAGVYIGFGSIVMGICAGGFGGGVRRLVGAAVFPAALSMVIMAGSELFTGNVLVMATGAFCRRVDARALMGVLTVSYIGNLAGSLLVSAVFCASGLLSGATAEFFTAAAAAKFSASGGVLLARGVLCNVLVCVAVWCSFRLDSAPAKLVMIFWCVFAFVACGFEHSVANMTTCVLGIAASGSSELIGPYISNLVWVTAGNAAGGLFVAAAYRHIARG